MPAPTYSAHPSVVVTISAFFAAFTVVATGRLAGLLCSQCLRRVVLFIRPLSTPAAVTTLGEVLFLCS